MNRTLRSIMIAVALIFAGAVLAGCGLFAMDGTWDMLIGSSKVITTQEAITEDFSNIEIDVQVVDVTLFPSPDGTCYYVAKTYDNMFCSYAVENGTLRIGQDDSRKWYQHIGIYWENTSLELYLPKESYEQLTITGDTGDVMIPQNFTFENVQITTATGDINCHAQVTGQLNAACSTGTVTVKGVSCQMLVVATSTGHVHLDGVTAETLSASTSTGDKHLTNVTCGSLDIEATTGDLEMTNVTVSGDAEITVSTGDVEFEGFDAANITITTDTGDVEGTLRSDKIFSVITDTGDVEVPGTSSGGRCEITTDTGDIEIEIAP